MISNLMFFIFLTGANFSLKSETERAYITYVAIIVTSFMKINGTMI